MSGNQRHHDHSSEGDGRQNQ